MPNPPADFEILYRDERYIAIHKPANMLVHRTWLASRDEVFVLQRLRNQIGQRVYPVHRLDRATDGVLLFALDSAAASALAEPFENHQVDKVYWAVTRGWVDEHGVIDHPVKDKDEGGEAKQGITHYRCLQRIELPVHVDRYPTSRYSWAEVRPTTGRRHQIRQHFKHIGHPLIGDTSYGKGPHNRFFRDRYQIRRLMLMARSLSFEQPFTGESLTIQAAPDANWRRLISAFDWAAAETDNASD